MCGSVVLHVGLWCYMWCCGVICDAVMSYVVLYVMLLHVVLWLMWCWVCLRAVCGEGDGGGEKGAALRV